MSLTRVAPSLIAVANNVTSNTYGSANTIPSFTFDASGVISTASNTAIQINTADIVNGSVSDAKIAAVANTKITGSIEATQVGTTVSQLFGMRNRIINGGMDIAQRGNTFTSTSSANNDDTYVLDRFYILSDGNDVIDVTQTTTVPTGAKYSIGLDVETINKKFGIAQIIENTNCVDAIGGAVTVSFQAKVSSITKLDNIKCAIVAWSGTADTVTSDIISAWGAEGTNPTLIANATYENTPANLNVTTSFATYSVTATVDTASTSNLILFIWSDVTDTTLGDFLYITNVQLEKGSTATPFERRLYGNELALCQRYCLRLNSENFYTPYGFVTNTTTTGGLMVVTFPTTMRATPTLTTTGPNRIISGSVNNSVSSISLGDGGPTAVYCDYVSTGLTIGQSGFIGANGSTSANLLFAAEL